jgi:hypothetical protein
VTLDKAWFVAHAGAVKDANFGTPAGAIAIVADRLREPYRQLRCAADFTGDGVPDLVTHSLLTGEVRITPVRADGAVGLPPFGGSKLVGTADPGEWSLHGCGDVDGDGHPDLLWQDYAHAVTADVWYMHGLDFGAYGAIAVPTTLALFAEFRPRFAADFDGDRRVDLVSPFTVSNDETLVHVSVLKNGQVGLSAADVGYRGSYNLAPTGGAGSQLKGAGDVNRDGVADLVWLNSSTGVIATWQTHGNDPARYEQVDFVDVSRSANSGTDLRAVADFNGDGYADLLWQYPLGGLEVWLMNGTNVGRYLELTQLPCTPTTCAALDDDCGSVSDGCGGTLQCGTCQGTNMVCSANQCASRCPTGTCGTGYAWNPGTCSCQKLTCECGGLYPRCKPCN